MQLWQSRRRFLKHFSALCSAFPVALRGSQERRDEVRRIGFITAVGYRSFADAFRNALRALGHTSTCARCQSHRD
jgi:hypothetical protein